MASGHIKEYQEVVSIGRFVRATLGNDAIRIINNTEWEQMFFVRGRSISPVVLGCGAVVSFAYGKEESKMG